MYQRITLGEFKRIVRGLPDDTIICLQSDSEGNAQSTCLNVFTGQVGNVTNMDYDGNTYSFVDGEDIVGIDLEKDKDRCLIILQPSL